MKNFYKNSTSLLFILILSSITISCTNSKQAEEVLKLGIDEYNKGDVTKAIIYFDSTLKLNPKHSGAFKYRGICRIELGQDSIAIGDLNMAIKYNLKNPEALMFRGSAKANLNLHVDAIADYDEALKYESKYYDAILYKCISMGQMGKIEEAFSLNNEVEKSLPNAMDKFLAKRLERAKLVKSLLPNRKEPITFDELLKEGKLQFEYGNYQKAIDYLTKAIELNKNSIEALTYIGDAHNELHQLELALIVYTIGISIDPKNDELYIRRAITQKDHGSPKKSFADYNTAIKLGSENPFAYSGRAEAFAHQGKNKEAIIDFTKAIELNPSSPRVYFNRAITYATIKKYDLAIKDFDKSIEFNPNDAETYSSRGWCYSQIGKFKEALIDYDIALSIDPNHERANNNKRDLLENESKKKGI